MQIWIHGESRDVRDDIDVESLVAELELRPEIVAVERNGALVPRARRASERLAPGDRIELVTLVGGG